MFWYNSKSLSAIPEKEFGLSRICFWLIPNDWSILILYRMCGSKKFILPFILPHINHLFTADYVLVEVWKHKKCFFYVVAILCGYRLFHLNWRSTLQSPLKFVLSPTFLDTLLSVSYYGWKGYKTNWTRSKDFTSFASISVYKPIHPMHNLCWKAVWASP